MNLTHYSILELGIMLERAYHNNDWSRYDLLFEEMRERGAFSDQD